MAQSRPPIQLTCLALLAYARVAAAEDGSNDVCAATAAEADDVRDQYDPAGHLVHELRLQQGRLVEEVAIAYRDEHAVARTELTPGHRRIARSYFADDKLAVAECYVDGERVGYAAYHYVDDQLRVLEKQQLAPATGAQDSAAAARAWRKETSRFVYDPDGRLLQTEVLGPDGKRVSLTRNTRPPPAIPVVLSLLAGGSYQSDTELYDLVTGLGIHRRPPQRRYGSDPLEVALDASYKFHRAQRVTSTDQTTVRFGVDYHDIAPRLTLFTFTSTDRNLPANLRINLEEAIVGAKFDFVRPDEYQLDLSFAPVWNFRSISSPTATGSVDETTSKLRGSFRARTGVHRDTWSCVNTFEFLPTLFGDDIAEEDEFWHRTVMRNTVRLDVNLLPRFTLREEFKYTWDTAMRAQATCPDSTNALCLGYAFVSTTSLAVNLEL